MDMESSLSFVHQSNTHSPYRSIVYTIVYISPHLQGLSLIEKIGHELKRIAQVLASGPKAPKASASLPEPTTEGPWPLPAPVAGRVRSSEPPSEMS